MPYVTSADRERFLNDAAGRAKGEEVELTIRKLIAYWNAERRGYWIRTQVERDLAAHELIARPSFADGWVDNTVRLIPIREVTPAGEDEELEVAKPGPVSASQETESALMADAFTFADLDRVLFDGPRRPPITVSNESSLSNAQSLMMAHDFSQLPVTRGANGRTCVGAVSWESMARTLTCKSNASLADCIVPVDQLRLSDDVLSNIPKITANGYIVTLGAQNELVGVVTTADLSATFEVLSGPFLLIGLVENKLRIIAESRFHDAAIRAVAKTSMSERPVEALTLGELKSLFDSNENWERLGWEVDRAVFRRLLGEVLVLRNRVMHFRGDTTGGSGLDPVRNLIRWLEYLVE